MLVRTPVSHRSRPSARVPARLISGRCVSMHAQVQQARALSPAMRRVTLHAYGITDFPQAAPDQWVKVFLPLPHQHKPVVPEDQQWYRRYQALPDHTRPPMRTYTVRSVDRVACTLDIDVVLHGDAGPGSTWAASTAPGDWVGLFGPGSANDPPAHAHWQLLAGDETALPAISAILEHTSLPTVVYVEVRDSAEQLDLRLPEATALTWLFRSGEPAHASSRLVDAVRAASLPPGRPYVWLAGEATKVQALRRHLLDDRNLDRTDVTFVGYWRHGRNEHDRTASRV